MGQRFRDRGYSDKTINRAFLRANAIPRDTLLGDNRNKHKNKKFGKNKNSLSLQNVPTFSTPYSLEITKIRNTVTKYLPILCNDPVYHEILSGGIRSVSRRAPTLGSSLSPSLFLGTQPGAYWLYFKGNFKCGIRGCNYCHHIKKGKQVRSCTNGKSFDISSFINCNTRFLIYLITCDVCQIQYVGRTTRRLKDRLYDHLFDIEKNRPTNVAKHWNLIHFKDTSSLSIQGIEKIVTPKRGGDRFRMLCKREVFWIFSLHTRIPHGLNFEWDISHYYDWSDFYSILVLHVHRVQGLVFPFTCIHVYIQYCLTLPDCFNCSHLCPHYWLTIFIWLI